MFTKSDLKILERISDAVLLVCAENGSIQYANKMSKKILNFEEDDKNVVTSYFAKYKKDKVLNQRIRETLKQNRVYRVENVKILDTVGERVYCNIEVEYFDEEQKTFLVILKDINEQRRLMKALETEQALFRAVQTLSMDLIFRLNLKTKVIYYMGAVESIFNLPTEIGNYPQSVAESGVIYEEDIPIFLQMVDKMYQGIEKPEVFRAISKDGTINWYKSEYIVYKDEEENPKEVVGKITNVQEQKELELKFETDTLTSCLRKSVFESYVRTIIDGDCKNKERHGFLIIDVDNFKAINDNLGHQFGDLVLKEVGLGLKKIFREDDYIGRIGGDEFMVCMKNVDSLEILEKKASEVLKILDKTYTGNKRTYRISGSIGVATYPKDGECFQELYDSLDAALYTCKHKGKNSFAFYHKDLLKGTMENKVPFEIASRNVAQHFDLEIVTDVFNLLFETKEADISLAKVLECIGSRFGVGRSYIFERNPDGTYNNTYEWCKEGITPQIEILQGLSKDIWIPFFELANEEGILYLNDLKELKNLEARKLMEDQNIKSFLHAFLKGDKAVKFIIGFDDCETTRVWSPIEINTLLYTSKIIAQFLEYKQVLTITETAYQERLSVLDELNYFAYIVDAKTYEIKYFNKLSGQVAENMRLGATCYCAIRGFEKPCEDCPMRDLEHHKTEKARKVIHNKKLDLHVLTYASWLDSFNGTESVFISCCDIGDFVKK